MQSDSDWLRDLAEQTRDMGIPKNKTTAERLDTIADQLESKERMVLASEARKREMDAFTRGAMTVANAVQHELDLWPEPKF